MEREFDAHKLPCSMYPSIFNSFPVIQYEITLHAFADDNQLYVHCVPQQALASNLNSVLRRLRSGWQQTGLN